MKLCLLAMLAATAAPASEAAAAAKNTNKLDETQPIERLIVSGSRIPEQLDEVPSSVTLIDSKALARDLTVSAELQNMLAFRVPGMSPATGTSSNAGQTLRGRKALVLIDGVPQSTPLRNGSLDIRSLDLNAIERVEVLKGATSVYGNGASGGIINYITKKPGASGALAGVFGISSRFSAVKFDDSNGVRLEAALDGQVDQLGYLVSASRDEYGLQRDADGDILGSIYGLSETTTDNIFTKFRYDFDDDRSLQLSYNYFTGTQDADLIDVTGSVNSGQKTYALKRPANVAAKGVPQGPDGNHNVLVKYADLALFEHTALQLDAYSQKINNVFFYSLDLANPAEGYAGGQSIILSEKRGGRASFNTALAFDSSTLDLIYGVDYLQDVSSQPLVDGRVWVPEMDMQNLAVYLQSKWVIADDWVVKGGLRRDGMSVAVGDYQTLKLCNSALVCSKPMQVQGGEMDFDATTYNIGVRYNGVAQFSPFVSFSQGADVSDLGLLLRSATVNDIAKIQTQAALIDNYEAGFSGDWQQFSYAAAFYVSKSELGTRTVLNVATGVYEPVRAPQKIHGHEFELSYRLNDQLQLGGNYSYVEGKDTDKDLYLDGQAITPPKVALFIDWQPLDALSLSMDWLYVGDRARFAKVKGNYQGSQGPVSHYDIVNVAATYQLEQWRFSIGVENLLNKDYYSARSQAFTFAGYNTKGLGTTVNLGAQYRF